MKTFDWQLPKKGQIKDATLALAPKQRNSDDEKEGMKAGKRAQEIWPDQPSKVAQDFTKIAE